MKIIRIDPQEHVIGVDAGGAKTTALLSDLFGNILAKAKAGSSHPRNLGLEKAVGNTALAVGKVLASAKVNNRISATFLGLPAVEEEYKNKKNLIRRELLKQHKISRIFKGKVVIGSDQLAGFRSGTEQKDGLVLVSGSGCVCHGWFQGKEAKADGWGYLSEMGSSFFIGQKTWQAVFKYLDGRIEKTLLVEALFKKMKVNNGRQLAEKIYYKHPMEVIPPFSALCGQAAEAGDKIARVILSEAAEELALSVKTVAGRLSLFDKKFPLVLVGSAFNSKFLLEGVKKRVVKFIPGAEVIRPEKEPAVGAVDLAIELVLDDRINRVAEGIKKNRIVVFPTDTVYGLLADASSQLAVKKVFRIKQRSENKFLPIFVSSLAEAEKLAKINEKQRKFLEKAWPGKITAVLKKKKGVKVYGSDDKTIALRVPRHQAVRLLLEKVGRPLVGTSANISGKPVGGKIKDILSQFPGEKPDMAVNAGELKLSKPSAVIDLTGSRAKILRK